MNGLSYTDVGCFFCYSNVQMLKCSLGFSASSLCLICSKPFLIAWSFRMTKKVKYTYLLSLFSLVKRIFVYQFRHEMSSFFSFLVFFTCIDGFCKAGHPTPDVGHIRTHEVNFRSQRVQLADGMKQQIFSMSQFFMKSVRSCK